MYRVKSMREFRKLSKYKNIKTKSKYTGGAFDSKKEAKVAQELDFRLNAGELVEIKKQHKIELYCNGVRVCNYYIDFVCTRPDGVKEYIEVKGIATPLWRLKWKMFIAQYKDEISRGEILPEVIK